MKNMDTHWIMVAVMAAPHASLEAVYWLIGSVFVLEVGEIWANK